MKPPDLNLYAKKNKYTQPLFGGATGQDDVHLSGEPFTGTKSGRGLSEVSSKTSQFRISLWNELVYDDVQFVNRDLWDRYGIPDIFGEDQLTFFEKRSKNAIIVISKSSVVQIEVRQA